MGYFRSYNLAAIHLPLPIEELDKIFEWVSVLSYTLIPIGVGTVLLWYILSEFCSPLRKYPGPFWARYTNLWRFLLVRTGKYHHHVKRLHEKYGPVVRLGPNVLDLDFPELIKTIYGTDPRWVKSEFYQNNSAVVNGKITYHLFSQIDQTEHARMKRPVVKYYSQSSVLGLESLMDTVIQDYCNHLERRFMEGPNQGKPCNLGEWLAFYSWDMNGAATFSKRFGYMDKGEDFDNTLSFAEKAVTYFQAIGQMPWLDYILDKNPIMKIGPPNLDRIADISLQNFITRAQGKDEHFNPKVPDYLQYFIDAKTTHPEIVDDGQVMGYILVNVIAGADTTAITLRGVFYNALRHPTVWKKLENEILGAGLGDVAPYLQSRKLPYLEAVVQESMRLLPAVCMLMERYVPNSGLQLPDNKGFVPPGTIVGLNPYIIHRNKSIWGDDPDTYRPERWLRGRGETEGAYESRMRAFHNSDLTFGNGSHICIGRNLALLEVYKILATLISRYEIELEDPGMEMEMTGSWFPVYRGLSTKFTKRARHDTPTA